ncbi:MAG: ferritin family protein [Thermoproteota archaeon]
MALAIEGSARAFYAALSGKFSEQGALFKQLARDEEEHESEYRQLLSGKGSEAIYSTEEERRVADYGIQILEDSGAIGNLRRGEERAKAAGDLDTALRISAEMEKDTSFFYHNIALGLGSEDRRVIYKIIEAEYGHLKKVLSLLHSS